MWCEVAATTAQSHHPLAFWTLGTSVPRLWTVVLLLLCCWNTNIALGSSILRQCETVDGFLVFVAKSFDVGQRSCSLVKSCRALDFSVIKPRFLAVLNCKNGFRRDPTPFLALLPVLKAWRAQSLLSFPRRRRTGALSGCRHVRR
jgi:hypothetical protein